VKQKTNQMVFQKVLTKRVSEFDKVEFKAVVHKSKYDIYLEDETIDIAYVNKETNKSEFTAEKVWERIEK